MCFFRKKTKQFGAYCILLYLCRPLALLLQGIGPVAQLNRAFDYGSKGFRFES